MPASDGPPTLRRLWSFRDRYRVLHLTWMAFFLTFVVWFGYAPFAGVIEDELGLTASQTTTLGLCNIALTIPARLFVGMALDRWGSRRLYAGILVFAAVPNTVFALAQSFEVLVASRLVLSVVGAGFVVGIRMVSEWFPPDEVGTAEGVYGGWGNFGAAAAAFSLPMAAGLAGGGGEGWRWAVGGAGLIAAAYGLYYLRSVTDTPAGVAYARPRRQGALEVTSPRAVRALALLTLPLTTMVAVIAWRVWREDVLPTPGLVGVVVAVLALATWQVRAVLRVNRPALADAYPPGDRYSFRTVVALCAAYGATFGAELAVVTILPDFFADTWGLGPAAAGAAASGFALMNLVARPLGGLLSDRLGRRRATLVGFCAGTAGGFVLLASLGPAWPWPAAVVACMACSFFVQGGAGAVFAIVPLVKKRVSGQIAGLAGAYGNVGAVVFLTVGLATSTRGLFLVVAAAGVVAALVVRTIAEPAPAPAAVTSPGAPAAPVPAPAGASAPAPAPEPTPVAAAS
jgi:NNP family nitrate/nitrite transporter-like MFS transporter